MMNELTIPAGATGAGTSLLTYAEEQAAILKGLLELIADLHNRIQTLEARRG